MEKADTIQILLAKNTQVLGFGFWVGFGFFLLIRLPDFATFISDLVRKNLEETAVVPASKRSKYSPPEAAEAVEKKLGMVTAAAAARNANAMLKR